VEELRDIAVFLEARIEIERLERIGALAAQKIGLALLIGFALERVRCREIHVLPVEVVRDDGWHAEALLSMVVWPCRTLQYRTYTGSVAPDASKKH
jgi:hypothetical protein